MQHTTGATRTWWLSLGMIPLVAVAALAGPSTGNQFVGNAAGGGDARTADAKDTIDRNSWASTGARGAAQKNINEKVTFYEWTPANISAAKAVLDEARKKDSTLHAKLLALENASPKQRVPFDLHPVEYLEWLKLQDDNKARFIRPPPNKITIVDQEKLATLDKTKVGVKYQKTTVCPRVVTYKPVYKTITVYYPG